MKLKLKVKLKRKLAVPCDLYSSMHFSWSSCMKEGLFSFFLSSQFGQVMCTGPVQTGLDESFEVKCQEHCRK